MTVNKIENSLEHGFVKHCLNCRLITDYYSFGAGILVARQQQSGGGNMDIYLNITVFTDKLVKLSVKSFLIQ